MKLGIMFKNIYNQDCEVLKLFGVFYITNSTIVCDMQIFIQRC